MTDAVRLVGSRPATAKGVMDQGKETGLAEDRIRAATNKRNPTHITVLQFTLTKGENHIAIEKLGNPPVDDGVGALRAGRLQR